MSVAKPPIVYDSVAQRLREAISRAETIHGGFIRIDGSLTVDQDGVLSVTPVDPVGLISADAGNVITPGSDGKLYVQQVEIPEVKASDLISTQPGNDLIAGSDGKLYFNSMDGLAIDAADKILAKTENGLLATVRLTYVASTGTIRLTGRNNVLLGSVSLPEHKILRAAELVENPDSLPPGTYIKFTFDTLDEPTDMYLDVSKLVDVYTAADSSIVIEDYAVRVNIDPNSALTAGSAGVTIKLSKMVSTDFGNRLRIGTDNKFFVEPAKAEDVVIDPEDHVLSVTSNGVRATIGVNYVKETQQLELTGRGGALLGSVQLPETRVLKSAELVVNPAGQPQGTYIKLVFNTSDGGTSGMYINVSQLVDVYVAADNSISIAGNRVKVNFAPDSPFDVTESGVNLPPAGLVSTDGSNLLTTGSDGKLLVDGSGIERGRDAMTVESLDSIPDELSEGGLLVHITA